MDYFTLLFLLWTCYSPKLFTQKYCYRALTLAYQNCYFFLVASALNQMMWCIHYKVCTIFLMYYNFTIVCIECLQIRKWQCKAKLSIHRLHNKYLYPIVTCLIENFYLLWQSSTTYIKCNSLNHWLISNNAAQFRALSIIRV